MIVEQPTETALKMWRFGSPQAERLCASLLHSEGFKRIDPQSPLGGPDGLKDVLLDLNSWKYLAAVYFPPTEKTFDEIQKKFDADLKGVEKNSVAGIAFFTNQALTPSEREALDSRAKAASAKAIIYHVEAIRTNQSLHRLNQLLSGRSRHCIFDCPGEIGQYSIRSRLLLSHGADCRLDS